MFFFSRRRRHTRCSRDWSSDVCSSDLQEAAPRAPNGQERGPAAASPGSPIFLRMRQGGDGDEDRKSVVEGKSVDLGGPRIIKKKKHKILESIRQMPTSSRCTVLR